MGDEIECPECGSLDSSSVVPCLGNLVRLVLEIPAAFVDYVGFVECFGQRYGPREGYFPLLRQCHRCGHRFKEPGQQDRARMRRLRCGHCHYSLIGNASGVCPECGRALTEEQKQILQESQNEAQPKLRARPCGRQGGGLQ